MGAEHAMETAVQVVAVVACSHPTATQHSASRKEHAKVEEEVLQRMHGYAQGTELDKQKAAGIVSTGRVPQPHAGGKCRPATATKSQETRTGNSGPIQ